MDNQAPDNEKAATTEHQKKSIVLEVQSVRHVLNVNTNPQQKEKKKNG